MPIDIPSDTTTCPVCRQSVPIFLEDAQCSCQLARANHVQAIVEARRLTGIEDASPLYLSANEQGLPDSDTQDAGTPMPSYSIAWNEVIVLLLIAIFVGAFAAHCGDGWSAAGQHNTSTTGIESIDRRAGR